MNLDELYEWMWARDLQYKDIAHYQEKIGVEGKPNELDFMKVCTRWNHNMEKDIGFERTD